MGLNAEHEVRIWVPTSRKSSPTQKLKSPTICTHNLLPFHFLIEIKNCNSGLEQITVQEDFDKLFTAHTLLLGSVYIFWFFQLVLHSNVNRESSVGIATRHGLDGLGIQSRCVGARFSARVQTSNGTHSASYTMGTGFFAGVMKLGRGVDHPPSSTLFVYDATAPSGPGPPHSRGF
jgi:hypothetical protein